jgi:hypothetical protein
MLTLTFVKSRSATLPDEDTEMQRELMERVIQILLEVETLTPNQKAQVQDGLASIRSDAIDISMRPKPEHDHPRYVHRFSSIATQI